MRHTAIRIEYSKPCVIETKLNWPKKGGVLTALCKFLGRHVYHAQLRVSYLYIHKRRDGVLEPLLLNSGTKFLIHRTYPSTRLAIRHHVNVNKL